ncbi:MAG: opsin-5 family protein [Actinomycetota bacterium]|nr:opsin-5 family protein [Actinomycetota bacterium]
MTSLAYLLIVVSLSVLGGLFVMYRQRKPRRSVESGIDEFQRELRALAPEQRDHGRGRPGRSS